MVHGWTSSNTVCSHASRSVRLHWGTGVLWGETCQLAHTVGCCAGTKLTIFTVFVLEGLRFFSICRPPRLVWNMNLTGGRFWLIKASNCVGCFWKMGERVLPKTRGNPGTQSKPRRKRRNGIYVTESGFGARLWCQLCWSQWEVHGETHENPTYLHPITDFFIGTSFVPRLCVRKAPVCGVTAVSWAEIRRTFPVWSQSYQPVNHLG